MVVVLVAQGLSLLQTPTSAGAYIGGVLPSVHPTWGKTGNTKPMGVFMKSTWASEVPQEQLDAWFGLVAQGRAEGPSSPYYVSDLGIQQVASGGEGHAFPPDAPAGQLYTSELEKLSKYFHLFDRVYIGTAVTSYSRNCRGQNCTDYAALETEIAKKFLGLYPLAKYPNLAWYITEEGCLEDPNDLQELLYTSVPAMLSVAPLPLLWSPGFCTKFENLPQNGTVLEEKLVELFCSPNLTSPIALHFQDLNGQTSRFQFPFYYNYTNALTYEDGIQYYQMLQRVRSRCPQNITEAKVNMEMFIEYVNAGGSAGEDNGAFILDADPREVGDRKHMYETYAEIGLSWALPHWYNLNTYANRTMDIQCTDQQIKNKTCNHPYWSPRRR